MAYHYNINDFNNALDEKDRQRAAERNHRFSQGMANYKPKRKKRVAAPRKRKSKSIFSQIINWLKR